ncbi:MAG TPA: pentapeptide repeat-containing protein, partial [Pyrinomonadaceae bacterium]|nr:pentapeptide repeat-containing protein [Pyrinomonadaceae bacterium]
AEFADAIFYTEPDFTGASFQSIAFERATFARGVRFTSCDFLSTAYFHETKFGRKDGNRTNSGHAYFDYALFEEGSRVYFQNSWFSSFVNFDYAILRGYIFFKGSQDFPLFDSVFEAAISDFGPLLSFVNTVIEKPDRIYLNTVRLRPCWFVNVDSRKFNLTNIDWLDDSGKPITVKSELENVSIRRYKHPEELLAITFRQFAANAEDNNRLEEASLFRRLAMETEWVRRKKQFSGLVAHIYNESEKRKEQTGSREGYAPTPPTTIFGLLRRSGDTLLHLLYRFTSFYGENWNWAGIVLLLILGVFAFAYTRVQFYVCPLDRPITQTSQQNLCQTRSLQANEAIRHSLASAAFQSSDYRKPINGTGESLVLLEKILAPLQAALLALAIRRKFMR